MRWLARLVLIGAAAAAVVSGILANATHVGAVDQPCVDVTVVYARGSGQELGAGEYERFYSQLLGRLQSPVKVNFYELGTEKYGVNQYQAITINDWYKNGNIIGAKLSSGYANDYGKSVDSGVGELQSYLIQRTEKCPSERVILGGYSQGAQVMGQALPSLLPAQLSMIDFVALFGDPKLYLPEGGGVFPDACKGKRLSDWRRVIGDCRTDNGSLGARKPYIPDELTGKVGLWCHEHDFICGSSKIIGDDAGHGEYKSDDDAIDLAAREIASRLKITLPYDKVQAINDSAKEKVVGLTDLDVAFIVPLSNIDDARLSQYKDIVRPLANAVIAQSGRVELVTAYNMDNIFGSPSVWTTLNVEFDPGPREFFSTLSALHLHAKTIEPALGAPLENIYGVLVSSKWKVGASKAVVLLTDDPLYNQIFPQFTVESVAKLAREIDPVMIYPIMPGAPSAAMQELADATGGKVIDEQSDVTATLVKEMTLANQPPVVKLDNLNYAASVGEEITFDASQSTVMNSTIEKYEWDFDGDGVYDQVTETPIVDYLYAAVFDGSMHVQAVANNGRVSTQSATVKIGLDNQLAMPQAPSEVKVAIVSTKNAVSTVELSWDAADALAASWVVSVNGVEIGMVAGGRTSIQVTDVNRSQDVELSVAGLSAQQTLGAASTISVAKDAKPPTPSKKVSFFDKLFAWVRAMVANLFSLFSH